MDATENKSDDKPPLIEVLSDRLRIAQKRNFLQVLFRQKLPADRDRIESEWAFQCGEWLDDEIRNLKDTFSSSYPQLPEDILKILSRSPFDIPMPSEAQRVDRMSLDGSNDSSLERLRLQLEVEKIQLQKLTILNDLRRAHDLRASEWIERKNREFYLEQRPIGTRSDDASTSSRTTSKLSSSGASSSLDPADLRKVLAGLNVEAQVVDEFSNTIVPGAPSHHGFTWLSDPEEKQSIEYVREVNIWTTTDLDGVAAVNGNCRTLRIGPEHRENALVDEVEAAHRERLLSFYLSGKESMSSKTDIKFSVEGHGLAMNVFGEVKKVLPTFEQKTEESTFLENDKIMQAEWALVIAAYNSYTLRNGTNFLVKTNDGEFFLVGDTTSPIGFVSDLRTHTKGYILMFENGDEDGNKFFLSVIRVTQQLMFLIIKWVLARAEPPNDDDVLKLWARVTNRTSPFNHPLVTADGIVEFIAFNRVASEEGLYQILVSEHGREISS